jgi:asparagine synthase (glutamine-hydrolysing)
VLALLALHGPAALAEMVGMWALALWDARERRLLVARDRYGQKPLYWRRAGGALRFASEIRPLLDAGERP